MIFSSGNGLSQVDDGWFEHAVTGPVLGVEVSICPPEEMIWQKAFITERERYDGADIMHLLLACAERLDWRRLLARFDGHWRVLLSYLSLFGFVYPSERARIPEWVMSELIERLARESRDLPPPRRVCQGTLLSREQYLTDIGLWGFEDARVTVAGSMTVEEVAHWTRAIEDGQFWPKAIHKRARAALWPRGHSQACQLAQKGFHSLRGNLRRCLEERGIPFGQLDQPARAGNIARLSLVSYNFVAEAQDESGTESCVNRVRSR